MCVCKHERVCVCALLSTFHVLLDVVHQLVRLAAVQKGPDGRQRVQHNSLRVCVNVILHSTEMVKTHTHPHTHRACAQPKDCRLLVPLEASSGGLALASGLECYPTVTRAGDQAI